jgi:hypothetical protein
MDNQTPAQAPAIDALDAYIQERDAAAMRATATLAADSDPYEVARQRRIAKLTGRPLAAVQEAARAAKIQPKAPAIDALDAYIQKRDAAEIAAQTNPDADTPVLRRQYTDPDFAKLAHDDSNEIVLRLGLIAAGVCFVVALGVGVVKIFRRNAHDTAFRKWIVASVSWAAFWIFSGFVLAAPMRKYQLGFDYDDAAGWRTLAIAFVLPIFAGVVWRAWRWASR